MTYYTDIEPDVELHREEEDRHMQEYQELKEDEMREIAEEVRLERINSSDYEYET